MTLQEVWEHVMPPERRWLGLIVVASALVHALGFMAVRIEMPEGRIFAHRPRQVTLMSNSLNASNWGEDNWALWLDWKDPSSIALPWTPLPTPFQPPTETYGREAAALPDRPSGPDRIQSDLVGAMEDRVNSRIRTGMREAMPIPVETPPQLSGTKYRVDWRGPERTLLSVPRLPEPRTDMRLKSTALSLTVNRHGLVESVWVDESCGDPAIDQQAIQIVQSWRFSAGKGPAELESARVVVFWDLKEKDIPERNSITP
jgi:TonB family protein